MSMNTDKSSASSPLPLGKRATSYDVANRAGVSQSTVSRCFKADAKVSNKVRAKVETAARALNYQPNAIARGLITRSSNIVAVIISEPTNLYYPVLLSQLNRKFMEVGMHILLFTLRQESDINQVIDKIWQYQVDGIIAATSFEAEHIEACQSRQIPLIFYNRIYPDSNISSVCCDHAEGERQLVSGLLADGRKSFVVMSGPKDSAVSTARTMGALNRLRDEPVQITEVEGDYSYDSASRLVRQLMESGKTPYPDAFVCANDAMAIGCIDTLRHEYSVEIPQICAVVGFDGIPAALWLSYDLTTVEQQIVPMVNAAVTMLMERIKEPSLVAERRFFSGHLRRGSSASLPE